MDILLLTTPPQHTDTNPTVILQPKLLQDWCNNLPTMNVIETVNMLKQVINPFNEFQINSTERLKLLEIYRKAFEEILVSYDELRLRSLPIAPEQRKIIAEDIMWLYLDLANGYKIIIKEAHESKENIKRNASILTSIYRTMELLLTAIVYSRKAHADLPPLAVLEIKQLFLFAEFNDLQEIKIKGIKDRLSPACVGNLFKHFILFSMLKDDVLATEDILELFTLLDYYTIQTTFVDATKPVNNQLLYSIDLFDNELPRKINQTNDVSPSETLRYIELTKSIDTMQAIIDQHKGDKQSFMINKEDQLLRAFLSGFSTPSVQQAAAKEVKIAKGIKTIHTLLEYTEDINDLFQSEVNSGIEVQSSTFNEETLDNLSNWIMTEETDTIRVLVTEESNINAEIELNTIVALIQASVHNPQSTVITGIIRKIRKDDNGLIKIGVQILPGHPLPFNYSSDRKQDKVESGLYFPAISALKQPASLIMNKNNFENNRDLAIKLNQQEMVVQPTSTILQTNDITQFNFKTIN